MYEGNVNVIAYTDLSRIASKAFPRLGKIWVSHWPGDHCMGFMLVQVRDTKAAAARRPEFRPVSVTPPFFIFYFFRLQISHEIL